MSNPHTEEAWRLNTEASLDNDWTEPQRLIIATRGQVEATLALAYEQHTALLMAYASAIDNTNADVLAQIKERLGLA